MKAFLKNVRLVFAYLFGKKRQVAAAVIERNGKFFLAQRKRGGRLGGLWEFPGGKVEPGETPEACLARELKEEFGIESRVGNLLCSVPFLYRFVPLELIAYRVTTEAFTFQLNEHDAIAWVPRAALLQYNLVEADKKVVEALEKP